MEPVVAFLVFERSTKGSHLYKAESDGYGLQNVYVKKSVMHDPPKRIKVTIESA